MHVFFFFNDTAPTEIYTLSLHDALPICGVRCSGRWCWPSCRSLRSPRTGRRVSSNTQFAAIEAIDRKSTRLNSSHSQISYAVFCLKKKQQLVHFHHEP